MLNELNFSQLSAKDFADRRKEGCYPTQVDLENSGLSDPAYKQSLSEQSSYFRATIWVTIGTTQFTLYSLLNRGGGGVVRPVLRSFGAE
jgi:hypothetical protein